MKKTTTLIAFIAIAAFAMAQIHPSIMDHEKRMTKSDDINFNVPEKTSTKETIHWIVTFEEDVPVWTFGWDTDLQEKSWHVTDQDGIPETWEGYFPSLGPYSETGSVEVGDEWVAEGKWAWIDILSDYGAFGGDGQNPLNSWIQFDNIDLSAVDYPKISFYQIFRPLNQVEAYIDFSTDGGTTWTEVRVNENIASNDYGDIFFEMYIGNYVANESNVSIRFRWKTVTVGGAPVGYGWQIDDIKITDNPLYDLYLYDARMNFFDYVDYTQGEAENYYHISSHYGQIPVAQYDSENALCWFNVAVENKGVETATPIINVQVINPEQTVIFDKTMEGPPLAITEKCTIDMVQAAGFDFELGPDPMTGLYLIAYEVFIDGIEDEFPANNVDTAFFYVTESTFGRDAKVPEDRMGSIGPTNWVIGGEDSDMIGTEYLFLYETDVKNIEVFIDDRTDVGTAFVAKIMQYDQLLEDYVDIATSTLMTIEEEHLGSWVIAEFIGGDAQILLDGEEAKMIMVAIEIYYMGQEEFHIGTDRRNNYSSWGAYVYFSTEASWYLARRAGICIRLNMDETHTVTFTVQDINENKLQGASISITGTGSYTTNELGIAIANLSDGTYTYSVSKNGYYPQTDLEFTVAGEDKDILITLEEIPTYEITFTVTDGTDPIEDATIAISGVPVFTTDVNGIATVNLADNTYTYSVTKEGYYPQTGLNFTVDGEAKNIDIVLVEIPTYEITFIVTDGTDLIEDATIAIAGKDDLITDAVGVATISLPDDDYTYSVTKEGYYPQTGLDFTVAGEDKVIEITLVKLPTITFIVTDQDVVEVENATISITGQTDLTTDAGGIATIKLDDGNYTYSVTKAGYATTPGNFTVDGEDQIIPVTLIEGANVITFTVLNESENAIEGAIIAIDGYADLTTNVGGIATIELANGSYTYSVSADCYVTQNDLTFVVDGEDKNIDITLQDVEYLITFTITNNADSDVIVGATITIDGQTLNTDANGIATIELAQGTYTYSVSAANFDTLTDQEITVECEDQNVAIALISFVETISLSNLNIYPNPTTGLLNIENAEGASISIINIMGQTIYEIDNANVLNAIDISIYPQGTYFIRVIDGEHVNTQKINLIY